MLRTVVWKKLLNNSEVSEGGHLQRLFLSVAFLKLTAAAPKLYIRPLWPQRLSLHAVLVSGQIRGLRVYCAAQNRAGATRTRFFFALLSVVTSLRSIVHLQIDFAGTCFYLALFRFVTCDLSPRSAYASDQ